MAKLNDDSNTSWKRFPIFERLVSILEPFNEWKKEHRADRIKIGALLMDGD